MEEDENMATIELSISGIVPALTAIGAGIVRSVGGWLENALEDGRISAFEWKQLGATIIRVGMLTAGTYYGLTGIFGMNIDVFSAAAGSWVLDFVISKFKSKKAAAGKK